jgi:hypothetical protein
LLLAQKGASMLFSKSRKWISKHLRNFKKMSSFFGVFCSFISNQAIHSLPVACHHTIAVIPLGSFERMRD